MALPDLPDILCQPGHKYRMRLSGCRWRKSDSLLQASAHKRSQPFPAFIYIFSRRLPVDIEACCRQACCVLDDRCVCLLAAGGDVDACCLASPPRRSSSGNKAGKQPARGVNFVWAQAVRVAVMSASITVLLPSDSAAAKADSALRYGRGSYLLLSSSAPLRPVADGKTATV